MTVLIINKQAQRRAAMDRRMHCIIPNESYNINDNTLYIFMTYFMKEHFNSFDDINFFHTFSKISQYLRIITLSKI